MINSKFYMILSLFFVALLIFAPDIPNSTFKNLRWEDIILFILMLWVLIHLICTGFKFPSKGLKIIKIMLLMIIFIIVTASVNYFIGKVENAMAIYKEIFRIIKYLGVFTIFLFIKPGKSRHLILLILSATIVVVVIQLMQYFQVMNINSYLITWYGGDIFIGNANKAYISTGSWRGGSTFVNPNVLGNFLLIPWALCLQPLLFNNQEKQSSSRFFMMLVAFVVLLGIMLTQSRSGFLCAILIFFVQAFQKSYGVINIRSILLLPIFFVLAFIVSSFFDLSRLFILNEGLSAGSMAVKYTILKEIVSNLNVVSLFIGNSPGAQYILADTEIGYFIYWYGLIWLFLYGLFILREIQVILENKFKNYKIATLSIIIGMMIYGLVGTSFLNIRVYPLVLALIATEISNEVIL